jgi:hypothetical protein
MIVNTRLLLPSVLVLTMLAASQEMKHAPTLQSCEADLNLWSSQIPGYPTSTSEQDQEGTKSLTVHEMTDRLSYLNDCSLAYPAFNKTRPGEMSALFSLSWVYVQEMHRRYLHFLDRHSLSAKFYEEDEAGKR